LRSESEAPEALERVAILLRPPIKEADKIPGRNWGQEKKGMTEDEMAG